MAENAVKNTLDSIMANLRTMVDSNSVIGDPITVADGTIIIPISKISYGFASGGGNMNLGKNTTADGLGAGGGGGITVTPVAFLSIRNGETKLLQVEPFTSPVDRVIEKMPDVMDKVTDFLDEQKEKCAARKAAKKEAKEQKTLEEK